eukprot:CAMPEP_0177547752 /NCGR_PEP_ID=MMETSP0369-20130122/64051_1 /TAXON_ID=447022 ORGANISM="Scrippsiella hangoei-like, Strain SHHI-4" /NCGR_SAMPLE_ID=MMETSP0369 /ASSEMBLY_ACC=CAM_ASM_000364 /LENGTH=81 /DNA_ID=CAMNT_0019032597 /DNA_START=39 /DNA_END=281 /DNA_ORIENTATION=+
MTPLLVGINCIDLAILWRRIPTTPSAPNLRNNNLMANQTIAAWKLKQKPQACFAEKSTAKRQYAQQLLQRAAVPRACCRLG